MLNLKYIKPEHPDFAKTYNFTTVEHIKLFRKQKECEDVCINAQIIDAERTVVVTNTRTTFRLFEIKKQIGIYMLVAVEVGGNVGWAFLKNNITFV